MQGTFRDMLDARESELRARADELRAQLAPVEQELDEIRVAREAIATRITQLPARGAEASAASVDYWNQTAANSPFRNHTMKQLVREALSKKFSDGATARQLLDLFHHEWGRIDIIRSSLSPQLSRLSKDGVIWRDGLVWRLADEGQSGDGTRQKIDTAERAKTDLPASGRDSFDELFNDNDTGTDLA